MDHVKGRCIVCGCRGVFCGVGAFCGVADALMILNFFHTDFTSIPGSDFLIWARSGKTSKRHIRI